MPVCYASQYEAAYSARSDNDEPVFLETQRERKGKNKVAAAGDKTEQSAVNDKMKELESRSAEATERRTGSMSAAD